MLPACSPNAKTACATEGVVACGLALAFVGGARCPPCQWPVHPQYRAFLGRPAPPPAPARFACSCRLQPMALCACAGAIVAPSSTAGAARRGRLVCFPHKSDMPDMDIADNSDAPELRAAHALLQQATYCPPWPCCHSASRSNMSLAGLRQPLPTPPSVLSFRHACCFNNYCTYSQILVHVLPDTPPQPHPARMLKCDLPSDPLRSGNAVTHVARRTLCSSRPATDSN